MSKLSIQHSNIANNEVNGCSCETCGRAFENPIQLTNLSESPSEVYNACPFCFSKQNEALEEVVDMDTSALKESREVSERGNGDPEQFDCPHYLGYLKKRPKNSPIPEDCLTCRKMIECLL